MNKLLPNLLNASLLFLIVLASSCTSRTILRSPYTTQQNSYHVMPTLDDKKPAAHYLTFSPTLAGSNDFWSDEVVMLQGKWHVAGKLGDHLQGFAGIHGSAGWYDISNGTYYDGQYDPVTGQQIAYNGPVGNKFTGSVGSTAGLALVVPLGTRAEWRIIGAEAGFGHEFGDYQKARKSIPDSLVELTDRRNTHITVGGFTEWIFKPRNPDFRFGYQLAIGSSVHRLRNEFTGVNNFTPFYVHNTFHFTVRRCTGIFRFSASQYYGGAQFGFAYRL